MKVVVADFPKNKSLSDWDRKSTTEYNSESGNIFMNSLITFSEPAKVTSQSATNPTFI